ncbi:PKD domain-containing protein [Candidatus Saccharibacteria bacterium TM7i]|nr:PKD domain-containing protein [Candidatus Saccharibacteria bacterium TM7i]
MTLDKKGSFLLFLAAMTLAMVTSAVFITSSAHALTPLPTPDPKPGSFGVEATKVKEPPKVGASIAVPGSGASFSSSPITVSGTCPNDLLVQIYNNNVMVGSVLCTNGSFSIQVGLFAGTNELSAVVYDELDQAGPVSNIATVTYTDTRFTAFGQLLTLTSNYGRRSTPTGTQLTWPMQLSGGTGPYAFSIDWGDGSKAELKSQSLAGLVSLAHAYKKAGIYTVNVTATDTNNVTAFLQVIAVSSGKVEPEPTEKKVAVDRTTILWVPAAIALALLVPAFWLGRRSQVISIRKKMLKERDNYVQK